ncbi:MAG: DUF2752 domain-containing protein [Candidatus Hydrogenedentes bacterium]|nr:DUF2752 domain-containing protein [Candidatus Hydrogenedentota bacterium]
MERVDIVHSTETSRHVRLRALVAALACAGLIVVATYLTPDPRGLGTHEQLGLPPCISSTYLGVPCPFCGMTTAFALMAHARLTDAVHTQPAGAAFFAVCIIALAGALATAVLGHTPKHAAALARAPWIGGAALAIVAVAWVYKMIGFYQ